MSTLPSHILWTTDPSRKWNAHCWDWAVEKYHIALTKSRPCTDQVQPHPYMESTPHPSTALRFLHPPYLLLSESSTSIPTWMTKPNWKKKNNNTMWARHGSMCLEFQHSGGLIMGSRTVWATCLMEQSNKRKSRKMYSISWFQYVEPSLHSLLRPLYTHLLTLPIYLLMCILTHILHPQSSMYDAEHSCLESLNCVTTG